MSTLDFADADYASALKSLLPRGRVWNDDPNSIQLQVLAALAPTYQRSGAAGTALLVDAFPSTAVNLLTEWELSLGLPDPCQGPAPTIPAREAQVVARLTNSGGQTAAYFIALAAQLGYTVAVSNYAPFRSGQSSCTFGLGGHEWLYTWSINVPTTTAVTYAAVGVMHAGDPLASWGIPVLECELRAIAPAHSTLLFCYGA
ncbi:phage tail protein [Rhodanobacter sp. B04]|uniref:YmfQ family protein n=1 Tax=Rhodanobacter sp. B04 TaxID=1945860 RepID=UPI000985A83B|nr:putative phage tail protein [Rhodanobacter sp. B04]OOG61457.1 phage tail protein [Rhodanobacter sp. B04]